MYHEEFKRTCKSLGLGGPIEYIIWWRISSKIWCATVRYINRQKGQAQVTGDGESPAKAVYAALVKLRNLYRARGK
jgi:hypothetical protein